MSPTSPRAESESAFGRLLREWRSRRRVSQLGLAVEAGVSSRHVSFIETGRAQPSREMVLMLARVLDVPLRAQNDLLTAAGYAAVYRETGLDAPEMAQVRRGLLFMLRQQEPYPAIVLDRHWNILMQNEASQRIMSLFLDREAVRALGRPNAMRTTYHPKGLRPYVANWEAAAAALIQWLHRDLLRVGSDEETRRLLDELLSYPDVPRHWRMLDLDAAAEPFLPLDLRKGDLTFRFFTTLTSLGTPYDITLHELRIECFFPADDATDALTRRLARDQA